MSLTVHPAPRPDSRGSQRWDYRESLTLYEEIPKIMAVILSSSSAMSKEIAMIRESEFTLP